MREIGVLQQTTHDLYMVWKIQVVIRQVANDSALRLLQGGMPVSLAIARSFRVIEKADRMAGLGELREDRTSFPRYAIAYDENLNGTGLRQRAGDTGAECRPMIVSGNQDGCYGVHEFLSGVGAGPSSTLTDPSVGNFIRVVGQTPMIGVFVIVGLCRQIQDQRVGISKILQAMPHANRND